MDKRTLTRSEFEEQVLQNCLNVVKTNHSWGFFEECYKGCPGLSKFLEKEVFKLYCNYPVTLNTSDLENRIKVYGTPLFNVMRENDEESN